MIDVITPAIKEYSNKRDNGISIFLIYKLTVVGSTLYVDKTTESIIKLAVNIKKNNFPILLF